ncbi:MAG: hypothetical protein PVJ67_06045 [Candidatus Pacearchaeota archaeon]|jgi:predicted ribosome quality control (RQC) complex YloA/Tae2 family protein
MKFREITLENGIKILLGKNAESNDELVGQFKGRENIILHTVARGSPFCVIEKLNPTKKIIYEAGTYCAKFSQDYRNHKSDVMIHEFTGKDVKKPIFLKKTGTWKITKKPKLIKIKKKDIVKLG